MSYNRKMFEEALLVAMHKELIEQIVAKPCPYVGELMKFVRLALLSLIRTLPNKI